MPEGASIVTKAYDLALWLLPRGRNGVMLLGHAHPGLAISETNVGLVRA